MPITEDISTPDFIRGVINLRQETIPVIDLRTKFLMEKGQDNARTCIIITLFEINGESMGIGMIVDTVSEVLSIKKDDIEPSPNCGPSVPTHAISGIAKIKDKHVILLDLDRVVNEVEMKELLSSRAIIAKEA